MAYNYNPNKYSLYEDSLTFEENVKNGAVITKDGIDRLEAATRRNSADLIVGDVTIVDTPNDASMSIDFDEIQGTKKINLKLPYNNTTPSNKSSNGIFNLCNRNDIISHSTNGATALKVEEDDSVILTSTTTYGQYYKIIKAPNNFNKLFEIIQFEALEDSIYPFKIFNNIYYFDSEGKNLQNSGSVSQTITKPGIYTISAVLMPNENQYTNAATLNVSPVLTTIGAKIKIKDYILLDASNIGDEILRSIDFSEYMNNGYFECIPNISFSSLVSERSNNSNRSDLADLAETANYANAASLVRMKELTEDKIAWFSTTSGTVSNNIITVYPANTWAAVGIKENFIPEISYIIVWKGHKAARVSYMHKSGSGWEAVNTNSININGETYYYGINKYVDTCNPIIYLEQGYVVGQQTTLEILALSQISEDTKVAADLINTLITGKTYSIPFTLFSHECDIKDIKNSIGLESSGYWEGKKVLFIGDSLTAARKFPNTIKEKLGINIHYHCKGGVGLVAMVDGDNGKGGDYDNTTDAAGILRPLSVEDVKGSELIVFFGGYNNRGTSDGKVGDCYNPTDKTGRTIAGYMQYCIDRIYETLEQADNLQCKLLVVTVDCAGKYPYIDADGYDEYPNGSGCTMETFANIQKAVAEYNSIPCCDLWHTSGINKHTWCLYGASSNAVNEKYTKYELDENGTIIGENPLKYENGKSYYQIRNGSPVQEVYAGSSPYPYNGDQLHKSDMGYQKIGQTITTSIISYFGN